MDTSGNLYGTTFHGGALSSNSNPGGTVFELMPPPTAGGSWTESILWSFGNGTDAEIPQADVILAVGSNHGSWLYQAKNSSSPRL